MGFDTSFDMVTKQWTIDTFLKKIVYLFHECVRMPKLYFDDIFAGCENPIKHLKTKTLPPCMHERSYATPMKAP